MAKRKPEVNGAVTDPPLEPLHPEARPQAPPTERTQPIHTIRLRNVRAAIWQNARADGTPWYTVTYSRNYRDEGGNWHSTDSFAAMDSLLLAEVSRQAFLWIVATTQNELAF
jgi:hypothetical protein